MRKEILATFLISLYWIIAGFLVAYSAWDRGYLSGSAAYNVGQWLYQPALPDPYTLGIPLAIIGVIFTFVLIRTMLPSRATQRRRLMRLLDEIGVEDIDAIQRKLTSVSNEADEIEQAVSLRTLLQEQKRKNGAD
ncbi:MAG: hypothetical protein GC204_10010 [Chloroflexi bacterium]|nr:hypothetical protein [Chloroflexota bacterium]